MILSEDTKALANKQIFVEERAGYAKKKMDVPMLNC